MKKSQLKSCKKCKEKKYTEDNYDFNLSFADENATINEELAIFNLLNEEEKKWNQN